MQTNTIIHGDCIEQLKKIADCSVDLIFADPPYTVQPENAAYRPNDTQAGILGGPQETFAPFRAYDDFCTAWLTECRRVLKETGSVWVTGSYQNIYRIGNIMLNLGFWILNDVTWYKINPVPDFSGIRFTNATETLVWCSKSADTKKYTFNHRMMKKYNGGKQMTSVWHIGICTGEEKIQVADGEESYPSQKPEELLKRIILSSTNKNDIVLDPFFGTGTTGAVAKKLGRQFIGIERDRKYIDIAAKRIGGITDMWDESDLVEEEKAHQIRVPFKNLVKDEVVNAGDILYTRKSYNTSACVLENGSLQYNGTVGSIHKIGSIIQQTPSCNGWKFWYIRKNNKSFLLDELRAEYRRTHHGL
jgi:DNA modification methylase